MDCGSAGAVARSACTSPVLSLPADGPGDEFATRSARWATRQRMAEPVPRRTRIQAIPPHHPRETTLLDPDSFAQSFVLVLQYCFPIEFSRESLTLLHRISP
jgi:hypothetical protein